MTREITTRRIRFEYPQEQLPRHFVAGDVVKSHLSAVLSSLFPDGEDFFVASVRNYRDQVQDPELRKQVGKFIGQEAIHGREHRELNDRLAEFGYPTKEIERRVDFWLDKVVARVLPKSFQLAVTAALEHYTATLAETLMTSQEMRDEMIVEEIRYLFLWHALEEAEHKAVAFDVFQEVSGNQVVRIAMMNLTTVFFIGATFYATFRSLMSDPAARDLRRLRAGLAATRRSPLFGAKVRRRIRDYNRWSFHPDDHDTDELLEHWRGEMFGTSGTLLDRLTPAGAQRSA